MRNTVRSSKLRQKRKRIFIIKLCLLVVVLVALFVALVVVSRLDRLSIRSIVIEGNEQVQSDDVISTVEEVLVPKYLGLFPRKNIFLYPKKEIVEMIREKYPHFREVVLEVPRPNTLLIKVLERKVAALWCAESDCYFLDEFGFVFSSAPIFSDGVFIIYGGYFSESPIGKVYISEAYFKELTAFISLLSKNTPMAFTIERVMSTPENDIEMMTKDGGVIRLRQVDSLVEIYNNLATVLAENVFSEPEEMEYIDLRFGNKVYYKKVGE